MNAAFWIRLGSSMLALAALNLTIQLANAQGVSATRVSTTPDGYQPGWQITVRKTGGELAPAPGRPLAEFAAPASGFDMGSYRGAVEEAVTSGGLVYDAAGVLSVGTKGKHALTVKASWTAEYLKVPEARCTLSLMLDGAKPANWSGTIGSAAGEEPVEVDADLDPGLHKADLHVACDKPLGSRFRVELALQAPTESASRPLGPIELLHAAPTLPPTVPGVVATRTPPAAPEPTPPPQPAQRSTSEAAPGRAPTEQAPTEQAPTGGALVAVADIRIRAAPRANAATVGILFAGQEVKIAGLTQDSAWYRLARGGYAAAGFLKAPGSAGPPRPITRRGY